MHGWSLLPLMLLKMTRRRLKVYPWKQPCGSGSKISSPVRRLGWRPLRHFVVKRGCCKLPLTASLPPHSTAGAPTAQTPPKPSHPDSSSSGPPMQGAPRSGAGPGPVCTTAARPRPDLRLLSGAGASISEWKLPAASLPKLLPYLCPPLRSPRADPRPIGLVL